MRSRNEMMPPADAGPVAGEVRPRAWCVPTVGGDYIRTRPSLPNNGDAPMAWEPLYDLAALKAAVDAERVAERLRCAEYLMQQAWLCPEDSACRAVLESAAGVVRMYGPNAHS